LLAPAVETPKAQAVVLAAFRILLGLMWLYNVAWKRPPDFGEDAGNGLYKFSSYAVSDPVLPPFSWMVEHLVLPNIAVFGWLVLAAETALAVLLLSGAFVRVAALVGLGQSLAIGLSVAYAPHEWPWSYWLMIGGHAVLVFASAGRVLGVDGVRAGTTSARTLATLWAAVAGVPGLIALAGSLGSLDEATAARGTRLGSTAVSISLGEYNLLGGLVLLVVAALLLVAAQRGSRVLGLVAAGVAGLAAVTLYVQVGFSDPLLGGTATSAALFLTMALVAAATTGSRRHRAAS
jgi:hypothetical protein